MTAQVIPSQSVTAQVNSCSELPEPGMKTPVFALPIINAVFGSIKERKPSWLAKVREACRRPEQLLRKLENIIAGLEKCNLMIVLKEGGPPPVRNPVTFAFPVIRTALASILEREPSRLSCDRGARRSP